MPNFWQTDILCIQKIQWIPLSMLIFGQNSCFLGPTFFEMPQPNWHYQVDIKKKLPQNLHIRSIDYIMNLIKTITNIEPNFCHIGIPTAYQVSKVDFRISYFIIMKSKVFWSRHIFHVNKFLYPMHFLLAFRSEDRDK